VPAKIRNKKTAFEIKNGIAENNNEYRPKKFYFVIIKWMARMARINRRGGIYGNGWRLIY